MKDSTKKYATLISTIAIQMCLGIAYIWSVFQTGIADVLYSGNNMMAGLIFSIMLFALSLGSIVGGKLVQRMPTKYVVLIGGVFMSLGFMISGFIRKEFAWMLWLSYSLMGGFGMGLTYSTTIAAAQKWFPTKKGMVTGLIVSALGVGGLVFTPMIEALIKAFGGTSTPGFYGGEFNTFFVIAAIFFLVVGVGSFFIETPKNVAVSASNQPLAKQYTPLEMIKSYKFWIITGSFALACIGGLMMIGFAKPISIGKGITPAIASVGVMIISICNAMGRFIWGLVSDKIGRKITMIILMSGSIVLSLLLNVVSGYWIFVLIGLIGFFYGGYLSTYPAMTAETFGSKNVATNYGIVLMGFGIGGLVSSLIGGYYKDLAKDDISLMFPAFIIAAVCTAVALGLMLMLKTKKATPVNTDGSDTIVSDSVDNGGNAVTDTTIVS